MAGVAWLAAPNRLRDILGRAGDPAALMGIVAGGCFALAAVGIRGASTSLDGGTTWDHALLTLTVMLGIQTALNARGCWHAIATSSCVSAPPGGRRCRSGCSACAARSVGRSP